MNSEERNSELNNLTINTESVQDGGVLNVLGLSPLPSTNTPSLVTPFKVPGMPSIKLDSTQPTAVLSSNGVNIMSPQLGMSGYGTNLMTGQQTVPPAGMTMKSSLPTMLGLSPDNTLSPVPAIAPIGTASPGLALTNQGLSPMLNLTPNNNVSAGLALSPRGLSPVLSINANQKSAMLTSVPQVATSLPIGGVPSMGPLPFGTPFGTPYGQNNVSMMLGLTPTMDDKLSKHKHDSKVLGVALPQGMLNNKPGDVVLGGVSGLDMGGFVRQPLFNRQYSVCTNGQLDPVKVDQLEKMMKRGEISGDTQIGICNDTTVTGKKIGEFAKKMYNDILMGNPIRFTDTGKKPSGPRPMPSIDVIGSSTSAKGSKRSKFQGHVDGKFKFGVSNGKKAFIMNVNGQTKSYGSAGVVLVERVFGDQAKPAIILFRDTKYGARNNVYSDLGGEVDRKDSVGKNPLWVTAAREALEESAGLISVNVDETTPFVEITNSKRNIFRSFIVGIPSGFVKRDDFKNNYYALKNRNMPRVWHEMDDMVRVYAHELVQDLNSNKNVPSSRIIQVRSVGSGNIYITPRVRNILTNALLTQLSGKTIMQQAIDNLHGIKIETHRGGRLGGLKKLRIK